MSDGLTALASENLNPSLRSVLEDLQRGHIRVPRFQRPFVWSDGQRLELLRSIRDNMPIGSLLIWRTIKFKLASFPSIGPHAMPDLPVPPPATGWQYVLDGHQRLTTLLGLLFKPNESFESEEDWDIQYSLEDQDFIFKRKVERTNSFSPLLPLWTLLDGRLVNKEMRQLRSRGALYHFSDEQMDEWEDRANQLAYRFQQCRVPVVVMVSDDLELAARTFQRVNSQGTPMSEAHLVAALTWTNQFDLRASIEEMSADLPAGWRTIDEGIYLQVCKGLLGLDITKSAQVDFAQRLKDQNLLQRAGQALKTVLEWLAYEMAVVSEDLLPYMLQVAIMAAEVDRCKYKTVPVTFENWFWRTSWSEVFSSATYRQVRREQEILTEMGNNFKISPEWTRFQDLPERFDFRSARVRLFAIRMALRTNIFDATGQIIDGRSLLEAHGRDALVRVFPMPSYPSPEERRLVQGASNRFLIFPYQDRVLRDRLTTTPDAISDEELDSLFISRKTLKRLGEQGGLLRLLSERQERLEQWDLQEWSTCSTAHLI